MPKNNSFGKANTKVRKQHTKEVNVSEGSNVNKDKNEICFNSCKNIYIEMLKHVSLKFIIIDRKFYKLSFPKQFKIWLK